MTCADHAGPCGALGVLGRVARHPLRPLLSIFDGAAARTGPGQSLLCSFLTCVFGSVRTVRTACHHCQRSVLLVQVSAWRCRGRIPLGADVTAAIVQTRRHSLGAGIGDGALPAELLRLQYAMSIVRLVNGIADSSQKGRTAQSVANLAEDAGEALAPSTLSAVNFCGLPFRAAQWRALCLLVKLHTGCSLCLLPLLGSASSRHSGHRCF